LVRSGDWRAAEPDHERLKAFNTRRLTATAFAGAESVVGDTQDFQGATFLPDGARLRRAVAYVEVNDARGSTAGSGFLVSPRLFLTNFHVIRDVAAARSAQITFDREMTRGGSPGASTMYLLSPDDFALFSEIDQFDYALLAVGQRSSGTADLTALAYCPLLNTPDRHVLGMNVNIIQHPLGLPKMIAIRNNILTARTERTLLYETDTDHGSSGSPVFNDSWDVVALHHWGEPFREPRDENGQPFPINVNEGIRISALYLDLQQRCGALTGSRRNLLEEALALGVTPATTGGHVLSPPRASATGAEGLGINASADPPTRMVPVPNSPELRVVVPVEITVRLGTPEGARSNVTPLAPATRSLTKGPEVLQLDEDYTNRDGYDPDFIPGFKIGLPEPSPSLAKQIAPLRAGEADASKGELKYQHFSIKMHKAKHLAMFTATNIDGTRYLAVDRKTGEVSAGAEGDKWFKDSRISESFWTGQEFYTDWSDYFDRGHLTRRTDPTWGTTAEAERANADTFHWTNCSPQHFRFNESARFWQGAERYVLENGVLEADQRKPLCVFQGPIFDDTVDHYAGDLQIPSSFFKVIIWKGSAGLKAVGLIVDQLPLLSETRTSLGAPKELASVNVSQWRVAITTVEKRSKLSFGPTVLAADTIASAAQPKVGEEAVVLISSFADLLR
jgi:endonuclease G